MEASKKCKRVMRYRPRRWAIIKPISKEYENWHDCNHTWAPKNLPAGFMLYCDFLYLPAPGQMFEISRYSPPSVSYNLEVANVSIGTKVKLKIPKALCWELDENILRNAFFKNISDNANLFETFLSFFISEYSVEECFKLASTW